MQCMLDVVNALQIDYVVRDIGDLVDLCIKRYCTTPPTEVTNREQDGTPKDDRMV